MSPVTSITVSVIIPMRNEEKYIARCLRSVLDNDFPREQLEILVADGRSTDRSREIVENFAKRHSRIYLIDNPKQIVPSGLNLAIRQARGKFIIRMDAHSEYPPDYISACVRELRTGKADVVGGALITRPGADTLTARAIALLSQHPFGVGNSGFRLGWKDRYVDTVPFGAFQRQIFDRVGLFREELVRHQDFEMNARIRQAQGRIFLSQNIFLTYYNLPTLQTLLRRTFLDGMWVARAWICYPVTFCLRHCAPLALLCALLLPLAIAVFAPGMALLSAAVLAMYLAIALASSAQLARKHGKWFLPILPLMFLSFHFVYGVGIVAGLLSPIRRAPQEEAYVAEPASMLEAS
ncbi:MAG: glycosyltransferase family 2 protein [Acidobacteria bacterium]|nr:glycosyltransferase family 2 protein [Acidobacteriota bacterium]